MDEPVPLPPPDADEEPVPDWHWQVIEERLAASRVHPERVVTWEEVEEVIRTRLRECVAGSSAEADLPGKTEA
jgi:hypothetical protein